MLRTIGLYILRPGWLAKLSSSRSIGQSLLDPSRVRLQLVPEDVAVVEDSDDAWVVVEEVVAVWDPGPAS